MAADLFSSGKLTIYSISEYAVSIVFGDEMNTSTINNIRSFDKWLGQHPFAGMYQTVAGYTTLSVFFDTVTVMNEDQVTGRTAYDKVCGYLQNLYNGFVMPEILSTPDIVTVPVCYGGTFGPDLDELADHHQLSAAEAVQRHAEAVYEVSMIGFMPGFAYLAGLDDKLATPRKSTPRPCVAAGSVGIAGRQTGIYPLQSPGGWQIIGRTPLRLFDPGRAHPSLLKVGDRVKFKAISATEFERFGELDEGGGGE